MAVLYVRELLNPHNKIENQRIAQVRYQGISYVS